MLLLLIYPCLFYLYKHLLLIISHSLFVMREYLFLYLFRMKQFMPIPYLLLLEGLVEAFRVSIMMVGRISCRGSFLYVIRCRAEISVDLIPFGIAFIMLLGESIYSMIVNRLCGFIGLPSIIHCSSAKELVLMKTMSLGVLQKVRLLPCFICSSGENVCMDSMA